MDLVIKNGVVVGPMSQCQADIGVENGVIVQLARKIEPGAATVLDAGGRFVLPGLVDLHTHFASGGSDDFESGTRAAAWGGVTTVVDFAVQSPGEALTTALERRLDEAQDRSHVDFGLHAVVCEWNEAVCRDVRELVDRGVTSFKLHLAPGCLPACSALDEGALHELLHESAKFGATVLVHSGSGALARALAARLAKDGLDGFAHWATCHPEPAEADSIARAATMARLASGNLYVTGVSGPEAVAAITAARALGANITGETSPHYLLARELEPCGVLAAAHPPVRGAAESEGLWCALSSGDLELVSSGHRACSLADKSAGRAEMSRMAPGLPGVELLLPLLFSEGVRRGRFSISRLVQLTATNPAVVAGLYPAKGIIQVGSDADLVLVDPELDWTVSAAKLHTACDHSPYEGLALRGAPTATVLRGVVIRNGEEFLGKPGQGQYLARRPLEEMF